jgi:excisionase family DNA binding protein
MSTHDFNPLDENTWPYLLTGPQMAKIAQCSHTHIYRLMREKVIPTLKIGKTIRTPKAKFKEWMDSQVS